MPEVRVRNDTGRKVQLSFVWLVGGERNFQLEPGASDVAGRASEGETVEFYWRDDGNRCVVCKSSAKPCAMNTFSMPDGDVGLKLSDARWVKQTV